MKKREAYRLSTKRRGSHFLKLMDEVFSPAKSNGVLWHHCIDLQTMLVMDKETCPVAQIMNAVGGDFNMANAKSELNKKSHRELQHAGLLLYNTAARREHNKHRDSEKRAAGWTVDYDELEVAKLQAEIHARIAQRYAEQPRKAPAAAA